MSKKQGTKKKGTKGGEEDKRREKKNHHICQTGEEKRKVTARAKKERVKSRKEYVIVRGTRRGEKENSRVKLRERKGSFTKRRGGRRRG